MSPRRVALVHDWLTGMRGGEKVLEVLCDLFPSADIYTLVYLPGKLSPTIEKHRIVTSPLQKIPGIAKYYRHLLPLMPWAIEQLNLTGYDTVISTSHCVAKGAKPDTKAMHWSYSHTPMRYIWDQYDQYFGPGHASWPVRMAMKAVRRPLQKWDLETLPRVTHFLANSQNVRERIQRLYRREAKVIYPPVDFDFYGALPLRAKDKKDDFYLIVSAFAPYKRLDIAIEACQKLGKRLLIIGDGQEGAALRAKAGKYVEFWGWKSNEELRDVYGRAKALLFPGEEDFGIVPVEAMAAGCPIIAFQKGGALETVISDQTGLFFKEQHIESMIDAIQRFEKARWDPAIARQHAQRFSRQHCLAAFQSEFVEVLR